MTALIRTGRMYIDLLHRPSRVEPRHVKWLNDKEIVRYSEQRHVSHTIETQRDYVRTLKRDGHFLFLIQEGFDAQDIGTITAYLDDNNNIANMGILIGEKHYWGGGFGTEAWLAVMNWLFTECNIRKVEAGFALPNTGMRRICQKSGMKYEGSRPDHFLIDGKPEYLDLYGKFK